MGEAFGGTIQGAIQFTREVPPSVNYKTKKFKRICGPEVENESLIVNIGQLKNVVLTLSGKKLKAGTPQEYVLDQKKCRYNPHVLAIPKDSEIKILASDRTNHNIHTYSFDNDPINVMMTPGQDYVYQFEEPELVKVECDLHKWMSAWILVADNPYFAISGKDGAFTIPEVPPGKYKLTAWHETLGTMSRKIKVGNGVTKADFDFSDNSSQISKINY